MPDPIVPACRPAGPIHKRQWGLAAACALALASCSGQEDAKPPPQEVGYIVLKAQTVPLSVELPGRTAPYEVSQVRPQVSGVVHARLFQEGGMVTAGQPLYQIDADLYRAAVDQASANLDFARASSQATRARADRYRPLAKMEAISLQELVDAEAEAKRAGASVAQARAALDVARINLRFARVAAPITGRIGRSLVTAGALVTANQPEPLATIQRLDPIYVDIQQSSARTLALRKSLAAGGQAPATTEVRLRLEDGSEYPSTGTLQFAESIVNPTTGAVTLRALFPNPSGLLLPGMFVRAQVARPAAVRALVVPQVAVSRDPKGQATVMVIGPGDKPVETVVTADHTMGDNWIVTAGLKPGDRVIVEGLGKLRPGKAVKPVRLSAAPAGPRPAGTPASR